MFCSKCGKKAEDGDVFCKNCGHRLKGDESAEQVRERIPDGAGPEKTADPAVAAARESAEERADRNVKTWLLILLLSGALVFIVGFLLSGLSLWTVVTILIWLLSVVMVFGSFKKLPVTQEDVDSHNEKMREKYAPKPPPEARLVDDAAKMSAAGKFGLWSVMQKGAAKAFAISAFFGGILLGFLGGLLPVTGVGGFASEPNGVYVQEKQHAGQEGRSAYRFEDGAMYYTDYYSYGSTVWGAPRNYTYRAGRVSFEYTIRWGGGQPDQHVSGTIFVLNFGETISGDFFGLGEETYSRN